MYREIEKAFVKFCDKQIECETCPYHTEENTSCTLIFAYKKGYADAKREQEYENPIQQIRRSGHP